MLQLVRRVVHGVGLGRRCFVGNFTQIMNWLSLVVSRRVLGFLMWPGHCVLLPRCWYLELALGVPLTMRKSSAQSWSNTLSRAELMRHQGQIGPI